MVKILICICTNNKEKLIFTLQSIFNLRLNKKIKIEIIIVENLKKTQIKRYIKKVQKTKSTKIYHYLHSKLGIPFARNICLKEAKKKKSDYICFVYEDSKLPSSWITKNLKVFDNFKDCSIISGPQKLSKFNIYQTLLEPDFKNLSKISWCATNNVIFKSNIIKNKKLLFDSRLNNIGGSDQLFFKYL